MYHFAETRAPNFVTNSVHIQDEEGRSIVTVWEVQGKGQDELWDRAQGILDYMNDYLKCLEIIKGEL